MGAEDLRGCESACHGVDYASDAVSWTLEGVGELQGCGTASEGVVSV